MNASRTHLTTLVVALLMTACAAEPGGPAAPTRPDQAFSTRMAFLQERDRIEPLDDREIASPLAALDLRIAASPPAQALIAGAGALASSEGSRVILRSGATAAVVTRTWVREAQGDAVQTRLTYVAPPDAEAFAFVEVFTAAAQQIEISLLVPEGLTSVAAAALADVASSGGVTGNATSGVGTSVEQINRTACGVCQVAYSALRSSGCGMGAVFLCGAAGIATAGPGLAICGVLVAGVCSLGLSQIRALNPSVVCNWVGAHVSSDTQWCSETPPACQASYLTGTDDRCEQCVRLAECVNSQGCTTGSGLICAVVAPVTLTLGSLACAAVATGICAVNNRLAPDAARAACRVEGFCPAATAPAVDTCASNADCASCAGASGCGWCDGACRSGTMTGPTATSCNGSAWAWSSTQCPAPTDACVSSSDCASCTARPRCGWCNGACSAGTSTGPTGGASCGTGGWAWLSAQCTAAADPCATSTDCAACTGRPSCGWCNGACRTGTREGPAAGSCGSATWSWLSSTCR